MAYEDVDVVIIGSGAAGGMAAWNLARKGVKVLVLEAGEKFDRADFWSHVKPWEARERRKRGERPPDFEGLPQRESPFTNAPGQDFLLRRVWGVGGKTNIWGRVSLRFSDLNMQEPAKDGWEIPWPIRYSELAPYYDNVEKLIGVNGGDDDQPWLPGSKNHLPPPGLRCGEKIVRAAFARKGYKVVNGRRAVLTKEHNGRAPCHYCGACGQGCDVSAFFNSYDYLLADALETGNLEIVENAIVSRILTDDEGVANKVQYFNRLTGKEVQIPAKRVIVAASAVDSTRILLNSESRHHPNGLGNGSDVIGRYLVEQFRFHVEAYAPQLFGAKATNDDGISGAHIYLPRFEDSDEKRGYLRGWGMQFWGSGCKSSVPWAKTRPGFGKDFKNDVKNRYPSLIALHPYGEALPYAHNRITVRKDRKDRFGVPLMHIDYSLGENELKMMDRMYDVVEEVLHEMKAEPLPYKRGDIDRLGAAIHEHGTCRMGENPKRSAVNRDGRMHEVENVYVVDGSVFPTPTEKNPTLTILANAWRCTDALAAEMKKGDA